MTDRLANVCYLGDFLRTAAWRCSEKALCDWVALTNRWWAVSLTFTPAAVQFMPTDLSGTAVEAQTLACSETQQSCL